MPDILAEVRGHWLDGRQQEFLRAVHAAVVEALGTPPDEPLARLVEHPPSHVVLPDAAGERFTRIGIELFRGRSADAKRGLYRAVVRRLEPFGVPPEDVKVVLVEVDPADVGFRGGRSAADVDIGYRLAL